MQLLNIHPSVAVGKKVNDSFALTPPAYTSKITFPGTPGPISI